MIPQALIEPRTLIENVSRRSFLRSTAATAGFVLVIQLVPFRHALAYATGADAMALRNLMATGCFQTWCWAL